MIYFKVPVRMSKWKVEGRDGKGEERARAVNVYGRTLRAFMRADQNREHTMEPNGSKVAVIPEKDVMSRVERMAEFVERVRFEALGPHTCQQLKMSILDSLGCAIGALASEPTRMIRAYIDEFGNHGHCTLIGGGVGDIDRAALYNSALIRYLDFNDSYLAKGETCHPSDNLGAILAAGEWAESTGRDLMTALAIAYQIQCRLSELVPVRARGFDHTVQGEYAVTAGIS